MAKKKNSTMFRFAEKLWPINRSLTGAGNRQTLKIIKEKIPRLKILELKTGSAVYDWKIPKEWKITEAFILCPDGKKICDFKKNNLHLLGYSCPVNRTIDFKNLKKHLHFSKKQPNAIPYVTSYYKKDWGFCIKYNDFKKLKKGPYKILIKSELFNGSMSYGELIIKGKSKKEILLTTYICHPSMANNEISGITVLTHLSRWLQTKKNFYTYRIIFIPETIGSIAYISRNYKILKKNVVAGYVITCIGDNRAYSFLPSRMGNTLSDKVAMRILKWTDRNYKLYKWQDRGSDERQFCSPGVDLPIASIMRSKHGEYPEYHTSLDKLGTVVTSKGLSGGLELLKNITSAIEKNFNIKSNFKCEPNLGKRNLYPTISRKDNYNHDVTKLSEILTWSDGNHSLLDIADKLNVPVWKLYKSYEILIKSKLIQKVN